jgi:hypothetical protein
MAHRPARTAFLGACHHRYAVVLTPGNFLEEGGSKKKPKRRSGTTGRAGFCREPATRPHSDLRDQKQADQNFIYWINSKPVRQQIRGSASGTQDSPHRTVTNCGCEGQSAPAPRPATHRGHPVGLRRTHREQPAAHQDSGVDGPRPLPRVVRPLPLPRPRKPPRVASPLGEIPQGWEVKRWAKQRICDVHEGSVLKTHALSSLGSKIHIRADRSPFDRLHSWATINSLGISSGQVSRTAKFCSQNPTIIFTRSASPWKMVCGRYYCPIECKSCCVWRPNSLCFGHVRERLLSLSIALATCHLNGLGRKCMSGATGTCRKTGAIASIPRHYPDCTVLARGLLEQFSANAGFTGESTGSKIQNLRRTRDLLLPRLLSGQIEVEVA